MKWQFTVALAFCATISMGQRVVGFEEFTLPTGSFLNGSDGKGGFQSGDIFLPNTYDAQYMSWSGWAISNWTDTLTPGFTNQYSAITGKGYGGSAHYAITYAFGNNNLVLRGNAAGLPVSGMYLTNSAYAYWSMKDGDAFSKKFGGLTGNDPDYFLLTIKAFYQGRLSSDSVNFYLADFRFSNNSQDFIVKDWKWVDLSSLGPVDSLAFSLTSTDVGVFGMNTPAYFCVDNITLSNPTSAYAQGLPDLFTIYPNPSADFIQIAHSENGPMDFYLFDVNGKLVLRQPLPAPGGQIDLQFLPTGTYFATLKGKHAQSTRKVVKR